MIYSTQEVTKKLGLSKDTLRYYEKEKLLPLIERNQLGHRIYSESDIEWIFLIRCLRDTDMPILKIKQYVSLLKDNDKSSVLKRQDILHKHKNHIINKISTYQNLLKMVDKKLDFYNEFLNTQDTKVMKCIDYADEWEHFKNILGGIKI
jgi:Predicted transcriptional regulators